MTPPSKYRALKPIGAAFLAALVAAIGYLLVAPVAIDPVAWNPPPEPARGGVFAPNTRLRGAEVLYPELVGPESITFDPQGRPIAGLADGRVIRIFPAGPELLTRTGGRPLGLRVDGGGGLVIADAERGLLRLFMGRVEPLATSHEGRPFRFVDDVEVLPDGRILFTEASSKLPLARYPEDIVEHGGNGSLFVFDPATRGTSLVARGLHFANGVAVGSDPSFAIVCETSSYRISRIGLAGSERGRVRPLVPSLPGFCDNVTWSPERGVFWAAIAAPRNRRLDELAGRPFLRKVLMRLPERYKPAPAHHAMVVAFRPDGTIVDVLEDPAPSSYAPITSVVERDGFLYLGSLSAGGIGRIRAP